MRLERNPALHHDKRTIRLTVRAFHSMMRLPLPALIIALEYDHWHIQIVPLRGVRFGVARYAPSFNTQIKNPIGSDGLIWIHKK